MGNWVCTAGRPLKRGYLVSVDTSGCSACTTGRFVTAAGRYLTHDLGTAGCPPSKGGEKCFGRCITRGIDRCRALGGEFYRCVREESLGGVSWRSKWAASMDLLLWSLLYNLP